MNYLKVLGIAALSLGASVLTSCGKEDHTVKVTGVEITSTPDPLTLIVGGAAGKVTASVLPADASDKTVAFSVAPEGIVTVAPDGTVTAVAAGKATITATAAGNVTKTCAVNVTGYIYKGTATVTPGTPNEFVLENIEVILTVNEAETAGDIELLKVKFAAAMPLTIDMKVPGATLTKSASGYAISGENIVPTYMNGTPYPERTITGLMGTASKQEISFSMVCGVFPLSFTGSLKKE